MEFARTRRSRHLGDCADNSCEPSREPVRGDPRSHHHILPQIHVRGIVMPFRWDPKEHLNLFRFVGKWILLAAPAAAVIGSACALFLWSLDRATTLRWQHPWLLFLPPLGGVAIVAVYQFFGGHSEGGNNL